MCATSFMDGLIATSSLTIIFIETRNYQQKLKISLINLQCKEIEINSLGKAEAAVRLQL